MDNKNQTLKPEMVEKIFKNTLKLTGISSQVLKSKPSLKWTPIQMAILIAYMSIPDWMKSMSKMESIEHFRGASAISRSIFECYNPSSSSKNVRSKWAY